MTKRNLAVKIGAIFTSIALLSIGIAPAQAAGKAPNWQLPFENGQSWLANGPHHNSGQGPVNQWGSLDFAPKSGASNRKVVAVAQGRVYQQNCAGGGRMIGVDHGNGWKSTYYHLSSVQWGLVGKTVAAGTYLGNADRTTGCGGSASVNHVHLTIYKDGKHTSVNGFKFGNYKVHRGSSAYLGKWTHASTGKTAHNVDYRGYVSGSLKSSTPRPPSPKNFSKAPAPWISSSNGNPAKLTVNRGSWSPAPSFSTFWQANSKNISKATGSSYTLTGNDFGKKIRVGVTASKSGYNNSTKYSGTIFAAKVVNKPAYKYVNIRKNANAGSTYLGRINAGKMVAVQCYAWGSQVTGPYSRSALWYKIPSGGWVAEALLETKSNNAVVPKC